MMGMCQPRGRVICSEHSHAVAELYSLCTRLVLIQRKALHRLYAIYCYGICLAHVLVELLTSATIGHAPPQTQEAGHAAGAGGRFEGTLPAELGGLSELRELWLNMHHISGSIPPSFGGLSKLTRCDPAIR